MASDVQKLRLRLELQAEEDAELLKELVRSAETIILSRRYPFGYDEDMDFPERYNDLKLRIAIDMYNRIGAEGQLSHSENGVQRTYGSEWVSTSLLNEVVPLVGVLR